MTVDVIKYGSKVLIRDGSRLDGCIGIVRNIPESGMGVAEVLLEREVIWPVDVSKLELVS